MRASYILPALLACSAVVATDAINAFKRVDKVLEPRAAGRQKPAAPQHDRLEKRASPFLTSASQSEFIAGLVVIRKLISQSMSWMELRFRTLM